MSDDPPTPAIGRAPTAAERAAWSSNIGTPLGVVAERVDYVSAPAWQGFATRFVAVTV